MAEFYASGGVVALILGGMVVEGIVLAVLWGRTGRGVAPWVLLPNLGAGGCLVGAAGVALRGGWWGWVGALLLLGGVLHVVDLRGRWG